MKPALLFATLITLMATGATASAQEAPAAEEPEVEAPAAPEARALPPARGGCTKDTDCKGARVCDEGRCRATSDGASSDDGDSFRVGVRGGLAATGGALVAASGAGNGVIASAGVAGRLGVQASETFAVSYEAAPIFAAEQGGALVDFWNSVVLETTPGVAHLAAGPGFHLVCVTTGSASACGTGFAFLLRAGVEIPTTPADGAGRRTGVLVGMDLRIGALPAGTVFFVGPTVGYEWH